MEEKHTDSGKPDVILTFMDCVFFVCNDVIKIQINKFVTSCQHNVNHNLLIGSASFRSIYQ